VKTRSAVAGVLRPQTAVQHGGHTKRPARAAKIKEGFSQGGLAPEERKSHQGERFHALGVGCPAHEP
jgi:hypothetical protein